MEWRHQEIIDSSLITTAFAPDGGRQVVFAVKHPVSTLRDLIMSKKPILYFSHHISELRRLHRVGEVPLIADYLQAYSSSVRGLRELYCVLEPTTIDEYRFLGLPEHPKPRLTARWPLLTEQNPRHDELVWTVPVPCTSRSAFPSGWDSDAREIPEDEVKECSSLLMQLAETLNRHVTGRDHQLIDQSKHVYGFRPLFNGNAAGGVERELRYGTECKEYHLLDGVAIFCPTSDRVLYKTRIIWDYMLEKWRQENSIVGDDASFRKLQHLLRDKETQIREFATAGDISGFADLLRGSVEACGMFFAREKQQRKPLVPDPMQIRQSEAERCSAE
ncbi:MAG: hypothetical protein ACRDGA_12980, partial [Bacteroidota bacterium]